MISGDEIVSTVHCHISCRLQKAKVILQRRIRHLKSLITSNTIAAADAEELSSLHISIATCYKRLVVGAENKGICGYISSALKHCKLALELNTKSEEGLWLSNLLERQQDVETKKKLAIERLSEGTIMRRTELSMPNPVQVRTYVSMYNRALLLFTNKEGVYMLHVNGWMIASIVSIKGPRY